MNDIFDKEKRSSIMRQVYSNSSRDLYLFKNNKIPVNFPVSRDFQLSLIDKFADDYIIRLYYKAKYLNLRYLYQNVWYYNRCLSGPR